MPIRLVDGAMKTIREIKDRASLIIELENIESYYEKLLGHPLKDLDGVQLPEGEEYDEAYYKRYSEYHWTPWHNGHALNLINRTMCRSALDVGCGYGNFVLGFLHKGVDAWGLEYSRHCVERASGELKGRVLWGDIKNEETLPRRKYDLVIGYDLFEHVPEPEAVVRNFCNLSSRWLHIKVPDIRGLDLEESRKFDASHITGRSISWWINEFEGNGFILLMDNEYTLLKYDPEYAQGATGAPDLHAIMRLNPFHEKR